MSSRRIKSMSLTDKVTNRFCRNPNGSQSDSDTESTPKVIYFDKEDYDFPEDESSKSFSQIRKHNVQLLSEQSSKYSGEIALRNESKVYDDDNNTEASEDDKTCSANEFEGEDESSSSSLDCNDNVAFDEDIELPENNLVLHKNKKLEIEKGLSVQNQLAVWENLLEIRIHSQKVLNTANSLPNPNDFTKLVSTKGYKDLVQETKQNAEYLLNKLIETQVNLASQFTETKKLRLSTPKRDRSESNESLDNPPKKCAEVIESNFKKLQTYRNSVLLKWEDRTKLLAPSGAKKRKHLVDDLNIVRKIDDVLLKRHDHIRKSQTVKGNYTLFGSKNSPDLVEKTYSKEDVSSPHIYDDTDFYHSQLRELIEFKSNVSSNAYDVTKQFAELQKLRQKMKKKVDTRASKGRKIRYVVHHKLINFMAPNTSTEWTEESKNELYKSLFIT